MADIQINSLEDAEAVMAVMAECGREIALCELAASETIAAANKELAAKTELPRARIEYLKEALQTYAESHRNDLFTGKNKSLSLHSGQFGFKRASGAELLPGQSWDTVLESLKNGNFAGCIREKSSESVDKRALANLRPDQLHKIGVRLPTEDVFFCKLHDGTAQSAV